MEPVASEPTRAFTRCVLPENNLRTGYKCTVRPYSISIVSDFARIKPSLPDGFIFSAMENFVANVIPIPIGYSDDRRTGKESISATPYPFLLPESINVPYLRRLPGAHLLFPRESQWG
jgi:hypothetical protein